MHSRTERRRSRRLGRARLTGEGLALLTLALLLGLAAVNSGNNLIYLLSATLFGFFVVGVLLALLSLRRLEAVRRHPAHVHADEPMGVDLSLRKRRGRIGAYSVRVREAHDGPEAGGWAFRIGRGRPANVSYDLHFPRRGVHRFEGIEASTLFPFGIFERRVFLPVGTEVVVFPQIRKFRPPPPGLASGRRALQRRSWASTEEQEFHGVREYRDGDNPRWIHWRTSARTGRLMVKDLRDPKRDRVTVLLDTSMPDGGPPSRAEDLERGIVLAASILHDAYRRHRAFSLVAHVPALVDLHADRGRTHLYRCLEILARLGPSRPERRGALRRLARARAAEGEEVFLLSLGGAGGMASGPWQTVDLSRGEDGHLLGKEERHAS